MELKKCKQFSLSNLFLFPVCKYYLFCFGNSLTAGRFMFEEENFERHPNGKNRSALKKSQHIASSCELAELRVCPGGQCLSGAGSCSASGIASLWPVITKSWNRGRTLALFFQRVYLNVALSSCHKSAINTRLRLRSRLPVLPACPKAVDSEECWR